jgi:hypothetical protein
MTMITEQEINQQFLRLADEHGNAYSLGNYKVANKLHKLLHNLYNRAKAHGCQEVFKNMIGNENENIRLWAAIFTLTLYPKLAEATLEQLSQNSHIKMTAKMTLILWKQGKLNLI